LIFLAEHAYTITCKLGKVVPPKWQQSSRQLVGATSSEGFLFSECNAVIHARVCLMVAGVCVDRAMMHLKARDYSAAASSRSRKSYGQYLASVVMYSPGTGSSRTVLNLKDTSRSKISGFGLALHWS